jgi:hypothetical protein
VFAIGTRRRQYSQYSHGRPRGLKRFCIGRTRTSHRSVVSLSVPFPSRELPRCRFAIAFCMIVARMTQMRPEPERNDEKKRS